MRFVVPGSCDELQLPAKVFLMLLVLYDAEYGT